MSFHGCRNNLQAYIVNQKTGEAYFYTFHTNHLKPHTQFARIAHTTYKTLLLNGWKSMLLSDIEAITKIIHKKESNNTSWYIPMIFLSHIAAGAVLCIMTHKFHSRRKHFSRKFDEYHL
jgi:hypothetical protein